MYRGRIQTVYLYNDLNYEAGGIRFYPTHKNLLNLLKEFNYTKKDFYSIPHDYDRNQLLKKLINLKDN